MSEQKQNDGVIWNKTSTKGLEYLSGIITIEGKKVNFAAFKNEKKSEKSPDYKIIISKPKDEELPF